jgi:hypothetical protein
MKEHLSTFEIDDKVISLAEQTILDTRLPSNPQTLTGCILCDADLYHLGTPDFAINNELVKQELELRNNIRIDDWESKSLEFIEQHRFFTSYCRELLETGKQKNILLLKQSMDNR